MHKWLATSVLDRAMRTSEKTLAVEKTPLVAAFTPARAPNTLVVGRFEPD